MCPECLSLLEYAIALYHDDFLTGFTLADSAEFDDWQLFQRGWLRRECVGALRKVAAYYGERASYDQAIEYVRRWLSFNSLNESAHRMMMQLYAANGQRTEALRHYGECVSLLDAELATPPAEETTTLYEAIKANTVTSLPQTVTVSTVIWGLASVASVWWWGGRTCCRSLKHG